MPFVGVTVTLDIRYSHVMKRQYLNVLYSPTAAYKGHTEGLCGFMDNNKTNDFMGPDGTLHNDAVQFGDSCKALCLFFFLLCYQVCYVVTSRYPIVL